MEFGVYKDEAGEWRWRLVAGNGQVVAVSGEGYTRRADAYRAIAMVKDGVIGIIRKTVMADAEEASAGVAGENNEGTETP